MILIDKLSKMEIVFNNFRFYDIRSKEFTWDKLYNTSETLEEKLIIVETIQELNKNFEEKTIAKFDMIVKKEKFEATISLINEKYYEICFSIDYENSDDNKKLFSKKLIKDIIETLNPISLVSGVEESVLTINQTNFYMSKNVYEYYTKDSKYKLPMFKRLRDIDCETVNNGKLFTKNNFLSS